MNQFDPTKDYYSTLGAERGASRGEIEQKYRRLAVKNHPDRGGDEDEMKRINEAYRVLHDEGTRQSYNETYDSKSVKPADEPEWTPVSSPSAEADAIGGRFAGAVLCLAAGTTLLFLVRSQWIWFLWPLGILAVFVILSGIIMARGAFVNLRESVAARLQFAHRLLWLQEIVFWVMVATCCYGVYLLIAAL